MWFGVEETLQTLMDAAIEEDDSSKAIDHRPTGNERPGASPEGEADLTGDGLAHMHRNLGHYPPLSQEQEQQLFQSLQRVIDFMVIHLLGGDPGRGDLVCLIEAILEEVSPLEQGLDTDAHRQLLTEFKHFLRPDDQRPALRGLLDALSGVSPGAEKSPDAGAPAYLESAAGVDWSHPLVVAVARRLAEPPDCPGLTRFDTAVHRFLDARGRGTDHDQTDPVLQRLVSRYFRYRNKAVNHNLRLVYRIAARYAETPGEIQEVMQDGVFGLIRAVEKYRLETGNRFSTYAFNWIDAKARLTPGRQKGFLRLPGSVIADLGQIQAARQALAKRGEPATSDNLARYSALSRERVDTLTGIDNHARSLDQPLYGEDAELSLSGMLGDAAVDLPEQAADEELREKIAALLKSLSPREAYILINRFGLNGVPAQALDQVSASIGLSRERVRQIEHQVLNQLRQYLQGTTLGDDLLNHVRQA